MARSIFSVVVFVVAVSILLSFANANSCVVIPDGSILVVGGQNYTIGETACNYCILNGAKGASMYTCTGKTGKYMGYAGSDCNGTPTTTYDIIVNGECGTDRCIAYNDVMYAYTDTPCAGTIMSNTTLFGVWGPLDTCFVANSVDIVIEQCVDGFPVAQIWHPPNYKCQGKPWGTVTYNACTPPYDGHTELLTLLVNPCAP